MGDDVGIDALFDDEHLLLGAEDLLFVLLQLLGDIAFGVGQRLLADPRLRHLLLMGVAHLDIVAEDVVVADFQRRNARRLALALLDAGQIVLAVEGDAAQVVQFGVHAVGDHAALLNLVVERIGIDLAGDAVAHPFQQVDLSGQCVQLRVVGRFERGLEQLDGEKRVFQLHQLAGRDARRGDARSDTLHIPHQRHLFAHDVGQIGVPDEFLDHVQPLPDLHGVLDRHGDPPFQQTAAHRRQRTVDDVGETALLAGAVRREEFEVADRELVDPDVILLIDTRYGGDVRDVAVLGEFEVVENRPGGRETAGEVIDAESLERAGAELLAELFAVHLLGENPFVEAVGIEFRPESVGKTVFVAALVDDLLGREVGDEFVDVTLRTFGHVELARRDVEERHARGLTAEIDRRQKGVLLVGQNIVAQHHARRHQLNNAALDQSSDLLGILQLFADGDTFARPHQFGQVGVDGVVGKSGQLDIGGRAVGAPCERDAQNAAGLDRVLAERLVKVADPEKQDSVGMHRLDGVILLHQGGLDIFFFYFLLCVHNKKLYVIFTQR